MLHHPTALEDVLLSSQFALPYVESDDLKSFLYHFHSKMELYKASILSIPEVELEGMDQTVFSYKVNTVINEIEKILQTYLNGYPAKAYEYFNKLIDKVDLTQELVNYRTICLDSNYSLYRSKKDYLIKKSPGLKNGFLGILDPIDLFHVPFEKRRAIGTNRFSIPGFPCIYLSDNLLTSWSECMKDESELFHAIRFVNHRPLYIVDMSPLNVFNHPVSHYNRVDYAIIYPLILACHSKINYISSYTGEVQFKSEYIVPQLLMQWYREKRLMVDGIRYLSCTASTSFPKSTFSKFNYVLPVLDCNETGYCDSLRMIFSATPVYSYLDTTTGLSLADVISSATDSLLKQTLTTL